MKKLLLCSLLLGASMIGRAQIITDNAIIIDQAEDTTQVNTINDIIVMLERVNTRNSTGAHFSDVWKRKSYRNIGYNFSSSLSSREAMPLNPNENSDLKFDSKWGAMVEIGHSYTLHKGAIANMVQINLDYTFIDLTANYYPEDTNLIDKYSPNDTWEMDGKTKKYHYTPWGAKKYDVTYGMSLGPSLTIAPFTPLSIKGLHFIKINAYFHVGYNIGGIFYNYKAPTDEASYGRAGLNSNINWGHGLSTSYGIDLSWKSIGIGWESRSAKLDYKSCLPGTYGSDKLKFKNSSSRIYLSIKY